MSHWYGATFLLPEILVRLGVAHRPRAARDRQRPQSRAVVVATRAWHRIPRTLRQRLTGLRSRYGPPAESDSSAPVDFGRSRCFHHRHGLALAGIRLNLAGREPEGVLSPGAATETFCRELIDDLLQIVDKRTGRPLIRRVIRVSDLYQGPRLGDLPDLVIDYDDTVPTGSAGLAGGASATIRLSSPKIGLVEGVNTYGRTGEHRREGLLIASGRGVSPGEFSREISVLDFAPTWARLLGVEFDESDGRPIEGLD